MFWTRVFSFVLGGGLIVARPLPGGEVLPVRLNEVLSYDCARAVSGLGPAVHPPGPVFREGDLIFASLETDANVPELMLSSGAGLYALELAHAGINRIRFELKGPTGRDVVTYYLTYMHDERLGSRYLEFSVDQPPVGHFEFDYLTVIPRRAENLSAHLEYAAYRTSQNLRRAFSEKRVTLAELGQRVVGACDHLDRENPTLARGLRANLDELSPRLASTQRMPASLR